MRTALRQVGPLATRRASASCACSALPLRARTRPCRARAPNAITQAIFTPVEGAVGGAILGLAAADMLLVHGRVCGISGIFNAGILSTRLSRLKQDPEVEWRWVFFIGLLAGNIVNSLLNPAAASTFLLTAPLAQVALSGACFRPARCCFG